MSDSSSSSKRPLSVIADYPDDDDVIVVDDKKHCTAHSLHLAQLLLYSLIALLHLQSLMRKKDEESSALSSSRYAKKGATSMFAGFTDRDCWTIQVSAYNRLQATETLEYSGQLTKQLVSSNPSLARFVCYSASLRQAFFGDNSSAL
jgi:hypothetical protein